MRYIYIYTIHDFERIMPWSHTRENGEFFRKFYLNRPQWLFFYPFICANLSPLSANFTSSEQLSETGRPHLRNYKTPIRNLTNIFENFINRVLRIQIQPLPQRGTLHNRKKPRAKKEEEGKKETALETRCLPRSQIPKSSVFSSHRNAISSNSPSAVISTVIPLPWKKIADSSTAHKCATRGAAARRRGARAACACGEREDARVNALDAPARRAGEGGTRSWKWGAAIDPAALVRRNGKWPFGKLHSPPSAFRLLSPRSAARGMRRLSGFFASFILLSYVLCLQARDGRFVLRFEYDFSFFKNPKSRFIILTRNESLIHAGLEERWTWATGVTYTGLRHL